MNCPICNKPSEVLLSTSAKTVDLTNGEETFVKMCPRCIQEITKYLEEVQKRDHKLESVV